MLGMVSHQDENPLKGWLGGEGHNEDEGNEERVGEDAVDEGWA